MRWLIALIWVWVPVWAMADALPKTVVAKVSRDAEKYVDEMSVMINGFGVDGAIDRAGLDNIVALARSEARAMAFRRLQGADLDGDGAITTPEVQVTAAAASAVTRGRMVVYFGKADGDSNGVVSPAELQDYANAVALASFSEGKAQAIYAVIGFDGDGDGRVTLAEVVAAVSALASEQRNAREIQNEFQVQGHNDSSDQNGQSDQPIGRSYGAHFGTIGGEHHQRYDRKAEL